MSLIYDLIYKAEVNPNQVTNIVSSGGGGGSSGGVTSIDGLSGVVNVSGIQGIQASVSGQYIILSGTQYYPLTNPSGYITGFNSGNYLQTTNLGAGVQNSLIYPLNSISGVLSCIATGQVSLISGSGIVSNNAISNLSTVSFSIYGPNYNPTGNVGFIVPVANSGNLVFYSSNNLDTSVINYTIII